jgi:ribosome-binding factor A
MKHRLLRVCELIKRELGVIVGRDVKFDAPLVTVRAVDITPDLKNAHVFVSIIGSPGQKKQALAALEGARQHLQHELSRRVILKYTPHLHFELDESIERGTRVLSLLDEIAPTLPPDEPETHISEEAEDSAQDEGDRGEDVR